MQAQGGVISRRQVRALGGDDNLVERMLRRRLWCVIHPGVYVDHTGTPTDEQLRMAAVLYAWPAVLAGESALVAHGVRNISAAGVTVAIDTSRRVRARPGMRVLRVEDVQLDDALRADSPNDCDWTTPCSRWPRRDGEAGARGMPWPCSPTCASSGVRRPNGCWPPSPAIALFPDGRSSRRCWTTWRVGRTPCSSTATSRGWKALMVFLVGTGSRRSPAASGRDSGTCTTPTRRPSSSSTGDSDTSGRRHQWADLERDLGAATDDLRTSRLGWGAVAQPCRLAPMVGMLLQRRGWVGHPRPCPRC